MLAEDTKGHVSATDEFWNVEEEDVKLRGDGNGKILARSLEILDEASVALIKTHSKTGMHHRLKIPEGLDERLSLERSTSLSMELKLVNVLQQFLAGWAIEAFTSMVRGWLDVELLRPSACSRPDFCHSLVEMIDNSKENVKLRRGQDI